MSTTDRALAIVLPIAHQMAVGRPVLQPARPRWCSPRRWRRVWRMAHGLARQCLEIKVEGMGLLFYRRSLGAIPVQHEAFQNISISWRYP